MWMKQWICPILERRSSAPSVIRHLITFKLFKYAIVCYFFLAFQIHMWKMARVSINNGNTTDDFNQKAFTNRLDIVVWRFSSETVSDSWLKTSAQALRTPHTTSSAWNGLINSRSYRNRNFVIIHCIRPLTLKIMVHKSIIYETLKFPKIHFAQSLTLIFSFKYRYIQK